MQNLGRVSLSDPPTPSIRPRRPRWTTSPSAAAAHPGPPAAAGARVRGRPGDDGSESRKWRTDYCGVGDAAARTTEGEGERGRGNEYNAAIYALL